MSLFNYKEKKFGKSALLLVGIVTIALAVASIFGGVYAVLHMSHWAKYIIVSVAGIVGLLLLALGITMLIVVCSMINFSKSVRDLNTGKGLANARLCEFCGKVISKSAEVCEHCGKKLNEGLGMKTCPECKTKNSAKAEFCEKCGKKFEE